MEVNKIDSRKKSLIKTITWRIIALIVSIIVAFIFTDKISMSLNIAIISNLLSMILYYVHERIWVIYE